MRESPNSEADSPVATEELEQGPPETQAEVEERRSNTVAVLANAAYLLLFLLIVLVLMLYAMCR